MLQEPRDAVVLRGQGGVEVPLGPTTVPRPPTLGPLASFAESSGTGRLGGPLASIKTGCPLIAALPIGCRRLG